MADITLEERVAYLESLLAARSIEPEDTTTIDELDPVASVYNEDLILVKQNGDEKKATVQNVKDNVMTDVDTKLDKYSTTKEMNEAIKASSPKVSQEPGNVVEMKTDGLFVSEDISGKVESFTQEAYDRLPEEEKNDGKIREITNAPGNEIPFVILDDTITTASNVLSALKTQQLAFFGAICNTVASEENKVIDIPNLNLLKGTVVKVLFINANEATNVKLMIGTNSIPIKAIRAGEKVSLSVNSGKWRGNIDFTDEVWQPYTVLEMFYDGEDFVIIGNPELENWGSSTEGYKVFANGYIEQWFKKTTSNTTFDYLIKYKSDVPTIYATIQQDIGNANTIQVRTSTLTNCRIQIQNGYNFNNIQGLMSAFIKGY